MTPRELAADGAPVEQGEAQGRIFARAIARELSRQRNALPWLARSALVRRVRATSARAIATQLPWQRERLEGIALAARVPLADLELAEALDRFQGAVFARDDVLQVAFDLPPELRELLLIRTSRPDAGGFPSVELAFAHLSGCLCGVNSEGIAAVCVRDLGRDEPSLRFHTQEILFRARDLAAGIDHLRRRASYAGGSGTLIVADANGVVRELGLSGGTLEVRDANHLPEHAAAPMVEIDTAARRLVWSGTGEERREARA